MPRSGFPFVPELRAKGWHPTVSAHPITHVVAQRDLTGFVRA